MNISDKGQEFEIEMVEKEEIEYFALEDFLTCGYTTCGKIPTHYFFIEQNGQTVGNIVYCKKHYDQIINVYYFKNYGFGETDDDGTPIVSCHEDGRHYILYCEYCGENHYHGRGDGHRWAHCSNRNSPYITSGYILRLETDEEKASRVLEEEKRKEEIELAEHKWKDMLLQKLGNMVDEISSTYEKEIS